MSLTVITPPEATVTLQEARQHLRIEDDETVEDLLISALIDAAQGTIDGPDGWVGRSFGEQVLEWSGADFEPALCGAIQLPCPPVIEVVSVSVRGADGVHATLAAETYTLSPGGVLSAAEGQSWPRPDCRPGAILVRYRAGYAQGSDGKSTLPVRVKQAVLVMVSAMYENRIGAADIQSSPTVHGLLGGLRVWRV